MIPGIDDSDLVVIWISILIQGFLKFFLSMHWAVLEMVVLGQGIGTPRMFLLSIDIAHLLWT